MVSGVLKMDDVETSWMSFTVGDNTNSTDAMTTGNDGSVTNLELEVALDLTGLKVDLDGVVDRDAWVWVADGATVVSDDEGDTLGANLHLSDFTELIGGFLVTDTVDNESTFNVVKNTEVLAGLLQLDDVHETGGVIDVSTDSIVDFDKTLHDDAVDLLLVKGILQLVTDQDDQRKAFSQLMGSWAWTRGISTGKLVKHPALWSS